MLPYSWLIAALPLLSFIMIVFFLNKNNKISSYFSITMVLSSFLLSCIFFSVLFYQLYLYKSISKSSGVKAKAVVLSESSPKV